MNIRNLCTTVLLLGSLQAKEQVLHVDTLVKIALKESPDIDISRFDFKEAQQRVKYSEGYYLPRLDFDAQGGKQRMQFSGGNDQNTDILTGALGASQLLYDFGKTSGRIAGSTQEALALEAQMQQIISDKILAVKQNYYEILKTKSIIDVQHKNVTLQKEQLNRAQKYLKSGIKTIIDVSDAQVQLEQAYLDLENAKYDLELKRADLERTLGTVPYNGKYVVYSRKLDMPKLSKNLPHVKSSLYRLEQFAYKHRYVLESSKHYVSSAKANVESQHGDYAPTLTLKGQYSKQHVDSNTLLFSPEEQGQVTVNMNWNLFSGFQTDAAVQEAKIAVLRASSQVQNVRLAIKNEVIGAHILVRRQNNNVKLSERIAKASLLKFEQAQKRYENDLSDFVELQNAQQGYIQSLSNLVNAYYDYYISLAQLDHSIGK